jgi:5-methylcytosine-specific restriction enzyme B
MITTDDVDFETFLKTIANNSKTGFLQELTRDGRSQQYGFNFENNNHWHDLITLIKKVISSKGELVEDKYFERLVFEWDKHQRVSLSPKAGSRAIISNLYKNIKSMQEKLNTTVISSLLKLKPQIILQGPPGTGKTRLAKEIAKDLCVSKEAIEIDNTFINDNLIVGLELGTLKDKNKFKVTDVGDSIKIKLNAGNEYSVSRQRVIDCLKNNDLNNNLKEEYSQNVGPYILSIAKHLMERSGENQVRLIQFHPSYSYEDFVRGITSKLTNGEIEYEAVNKILAEFAKTALDNYRDHRKDTTTLSKEKWAESMFVEYADQIEESLAREPKYMIGDSIAYVFEVEEDAFRYKGDDWVQHYRGLRMKFSQLLDAYLRGAVSRKDFKKLYQSGLVNQHATYFSKILKDFRKFLATKPAYAENVVRPALRNYVLIIDEINRANLSSVLGELIYALEYRNEAVTGIYEVEGDRQITLPPNLFIIGTMNTADRSVGHIDYAIRRRFSFYPVLPDENVIQELGSPEALELYKKIRNLFISDDPKIVSCLSPEFNSEDVMLGHSYFLEKDKEKLRLRFKYEIKPILREYIKDGILLDGAEAVLKDLETW